MTVPEDLLAVREGKTIKDYNERNHLLIESSNVAKMSLQVSEETKDNSEIKVHMVTKMI